MSTKEHPRIYGVSRKAKEPLHDFICDALKEQGAVVIYRSPPGEAPLRLTFELPSGERAGVIVYAFFANSKLTKNRPDDEHRFQVKYGTKDGKHHELWQDPYGLYTTLFCGIDLERGVFVGADPVLHSPTRFFISVEFKRAQVEEIVRSGWHAWERERGKSGRDEPVEVLVGGTKRNFLKYIQFERAAVGESQGHRHLLADRHPALGQIEAFGLQKSPEVGAARLHALAHEFSLSENEVLDLIAKARRLKMAVRGWVAEEHLERMLNKIPGVTCTRLDEEGGADLSVVFKGISLSIECKNVLRVTHADGLPRVDFQRTRASKGDPCSRFYSRKNFDILAACLNALEDKWVYKFMPTDRLKPHETCVGKLSSKVKVDASWFSDALEVLEITAKSKQ